MTLESLAQRAGMSRSAFADASRDTIGSIPRHYLQGWRTRLVQRALRHDQPLKRMPSTSVRAAKRRCRARSRCRPGIRHGSGSRG